MAVGPLSTHADVRQRTRFLLTLRLEVAAMWIKLLAAVGAATMFQTPGAAPPPSEQSVLVLTNANLIDGVGSQPRRGVTVLVRNGRIEAVTSATGTLAANARVIDLDGRWLLPGLIDAHVHLRDLESARAALRSGVTTARSMGVDHFVDVGIAELHRAGATDLPHVVPSGYHVRRRPSDALFTDFPSLMPLRGGVAGTTAVQQVVQANVSRGARVVKVMATERAGTADADFRRRALGDEELRAAVEEASRANLPVAAHAHTDDGARAAILAGVRTIEHGTLMSESTLALMRERQICFVPTLSFWADMLQPGGEYDGISLSVRARAMQPRVRRTVATAARLGVRIAAGSDMRYDASSVYRLADELVELTRSGMTPMAAIQAGTSTAAACLGLGEQTGTIRAGLEADMIAVDADPTRDVAALHDPVLVINDGAVALDRLSN